MKYYSNEIVFRGHPDKVCDQISDALLDAFLRGDKNSRCGIETVGGKGIIFITGEVTSNTNVDVEKVTRRVLRDIGYDTDKYQIINNIGKQSQDIALGTNNEVGGAGDQGMMFGFATRQTKEYLPKAQVILQKFSKEYDELRKKDHRFLPDGKAQITGMYDGYNLKKIKDITISYQNTEKEREETDQILKDIVNKICKSEGVEVERFLINPTGRFFIGGFDGDAGLTGRKIVIDTYESFAKVGGGAFSGKDPTKVDRSGAYKARKIAKDIIRKNKDLDWVTVQLSYAIGIEEPLAIYINSDKGELEPDQSLYEECKPRNIIKDLDLLNKCYEETAKFGHFQN